MDLYHFALIKNESPEDAGVFTFDEGFRLTIHTTPREYKNSQWRAVGDVFVNWARDLRTIQAHHRRDYFKLIEFSHPYESFGLPRNQHLVEL